jgi:S-DNA-T family DNA segregation ATPase FtsK/SpoIIIE
MKTSNNSSFITGAVLICISALFTICLITLPFTYDYSSNNANVFTIIGNLFYNAYGFSSILIPVFLLISGLSCFASKWTSKKTMILLTAVFPFFTAVVTEKICRSIIELGTTSSNIIKLVIAIATGIMLIVVEIFGAGAIAEGINQRLFHNPKKGQPPLEPEEKSSEKTQKIQAKTEEEKKSEENTEKTAETTQKIQTNPVFDDALSAVTLDETSVSEEEVYSDDDDGEDLSELSLNFNQMKQIDVPESPKHDINTLQKEEKEEPADSNPASVITVEEYAALTTPPEEEPTEELEWTNLPPAPDKLPPEYDEDYVEETKAETEEPEEKPKRSFFNFRKNQEKPSPYSSKISLTDEDAEDSNEADEDFDDDDSQGLADNNKYPSKINLEDDEPLDEGTDERTIEPEFYDIDLNDDDLSFPEQDEDDEEEIEIPRRKLSNNIFNQISEQENESIGLTSPAATVFSSMDDDIQKEAGLNPAKKEAPKPAKPKKAPAKKGPYIIPTNLLTAYKDDQYWIIDDATKQASENLKRTLSEFNIDAEIIGIKKGPVVTMFEILPAPGVKLSKIVALQDNIALSLAAQSVRIVAPIPGKQAVGIEVPNKKRSVVGFREIIEMDFPEWKKMAVPVILGKDILGKAQLIDLVKTPHMLIAGATGSGKSVCVNSLILSILYKRSFNDVKLILVDPKVVELKLYNNIPHLLTPVITEPKKAIQALQWCLCEMERRYALLDGMGVRDISNYNSKIKEKNIATEKLPYIVVIIDEFADLMATSGKELENIVARLTAMSRAVGIHLVLATQRPSVNVITGLIKANIPSRIAFMVASRTDSNIIIDTVGAEKLLGRGDMLYASAVDPAPVRIQGTFVSDQEVENTVEAVKEYGEPDYIDDEIFVDDDDDYGENVDLFGNAYDEDPLYEQALDVVVQAGKASASYIQRKLKIGYNRAARLVEEMEERGIVGPANGSKPREIIHFPD